MREPPENLVMKDADGGESGESLVVQSIVVVVSGVGGDGVMLARFIGLLSV